MVGADRIAANGDTANKIGTYSVSVLAKEHGVPFYVAAPLSTVDMTIESGDAIPIEERDPAEVTCFRGAQVAPAGAPGAPPGVRRHAGRQHRRHHHRGRRAAAALRAGPRGRLRRRGVPAVSRDSLRACLPHGGRPRHAALPAHRPDLQAHGPHPQPAGHGAPPAPAAAARGHRDRRQPALPPGQDQRLLRRRRRVRRRVAVQPRGAAHGHRRRRRRLPRVPRRLHLPRHERRRAHRHRPQRLPRGAPAHRRHRHPGRQGGRGPVAVRRGGPRRRPAHHRLPGEAAA